MPTISQNLNIKQVQSLVMTPQLQQSLKMLELSTQDLVEYINQELEKNPLLEKEEYLSNDDEEIVDLSESNLNSENIIPQENKDTFEVASDRSSSENDSNIKDYDSIWEDRIDNLKNNKEYTNNSSKSSEYQQGNVSGREHFDKTSYFEQTIAEEISFQFHIIDQINLEFSDNKDRLMAYQLLESLDSNGYVTTNLYELADKLSCHKELLDSILIRCQNFSPTGIFARNLKECLVLQIKDINRYDPIMEIMLDNLHLVADCDFKQLSKICKIRKDEVIEMCNEVRLLNPRPANIFNHDYTQLVVPDIFLRKNDKDEWKLELNTETLPRLLVNGEYYSQIKANASDEKEIKYISESFSSANWFIKAINQRAETILKVATEIVIQQEEFLDKGIMYLKPMIQSNIAEKLDIHESTVGRVTSNKYISTPRGVFELKYFFSSAIQGSMGNGDISNKAVKQVISELINKETIDNILSDDKISERLKSKGMNIARRTVSKYRKSLNIPSSTKRRKIKEYKI